MAKEPKRRGSIMSGFDTSKYSLENPYKNLQPHEPIGGHSRRESIEEGLYLYTTHENHSRLHIDDKGIEENEELKRLAQRCWFEKKREEGYDEQAIVEMWHMKFIKNYI